mgnify:FL=1
MLQKFTSCKDLLQFGIITYFCQSIKILNKKLYIYYYGLSDLPKIENLDLAKYEHLCNTTKKALDEIYNFLCKLNVEKIYSYSFLSLLYNNYMYLNQFRNEIYINILNNTFGKDFMQKYNKFLEVSNYNNQYCELFQITNDKEEIKNEIIENLKNIIVINKKDISINTNELDILTDNKFRIRICLDSDNIYIPNIFIALEFRYKGIGKILSQ